MTAEEQREAEPSADPRQSDPWKVAFVTLLLVALVTVVVWVLLESRLLVVRQVEVTGLDRLTEEEVVAAADVATGTPLARVDTGAVVERVAELRLVESVAVRRGWPATLRVEVTERTPVLALSVEGGYHLVDREGVRVEEADTRPEGYPLVRVTGEVRGNPAVAESARVVGALPESLVDAVDTVVATDRARITLELVGGATVMWGDSERGADKARALEVLLEQHPPDPGRHYDVSAAGVAVVR
ncbi:FtsQ-type POTRA domain-containing protein [Thermobifida halotolerans]|uniref:FtsQ-type POTRA domain-containing protein n=1 Tax=Thermobifida halotolerans TaxID=483545 RepID=A0A399G451_9ACTN|nr:FtsQ-type POTRA domain-containing protein [Thermobifida halotolerans]UOE20225.1 FtsQ-type POTRA domain-containing protein [Thermobifida halotolerans]